MRLNNSSTQVYMALRPGETLDEDACGDLLFTSTAPAFRTDMLLSRNVTSRTYSFYYPRTRPGSDRYFIVASTNANYRDWAGLTTEEYAAGKRESDRDDARRRWRNTCPTFAERSTWVEAATPLTFQRYTLHLDGASFGTKFEGLAVSRAMPAADRRPLSRRQRRHYHVRLARRGQLRRDRRQRGRCVLLEAGGKRRERHELAKRFYAAIPHRDPFLLVDDIAERSDSRIVCTKRFSGSEEFFAGHYPDYPLVPGVLLCEAAMQSGAILLSQHLAARTARAVATRMHDVRFKRMVRPGETIRIEVDLVERLADAFFLKAKVTVDGKVAVRFEFACTAAQRRQ